PVTQVTQTCNGTTPVLNISWGINDRPLQQFYVGVDNDSNWWNGDWTVGVNQQNSVNSQAGFFPTGSNSGGLVVQPNTNYKVRVFFAETDEFNQEGSIVTTNCQ